MALPVFQAVGPLEGNSTAQTVAWPTHQADDIGVLIIETAGDGVTQTPTGWTHFPGSPVIDVASAAGSKLHVLWKRAASGAEAAASVGDSGDHQVMRIFTFRGCVTTGDPFNVVATGNKTVASTTATAVGVTTTIAEALILLVVGRANDSASAIHFGAFTNANLANIAERGEGGTGLGHGGGFVLATGEKAVAGDTGTSTSTKSDTSTETYMTIALKPPPPAASGTAYSFKTAIYTGTGSSLGISGLGFQPDFVMVKRLATADDAVFRTKFMSGVNSAHTRDDTANAAQMITSLDADGFTVGTDGHVNQAGIDFVYWAVKGNGNYDFQPFSYVGSGVDNRLVTGVNFQPDFVMVKGDGANTGGYRYSTQAGDASAVFYAGADQTNRIQTIESDGFTVGTDSSVNVSGRVYHGIAFKAVSGKTSVFQYTGNNTGGRELTNPGFRPGLVWLKKTGDKFPKFKTTAHVGANSQAFDGVQGTTDITSLTDNGFTVGTTLEVNENLGVYNVLALYDPTVGGSPANTTNFFQFF